MSIADMLIHVNPELDTQNRTKLEKMVKGCVGVGSAEFDHHLHPHAMIVKYDPDKIQGLAILNIVRSVDPVATRIGL